MSGDDASKPIDEGCGWLVSSILLAHQSSNS
jgi:hypothetical protein